MREPGNPKVSKKFEPNDEREQIVNLFIDYRISPYHTSTPLPQSLYDCLDSVIPEIVKDDLNIVYFQVQVMRSVSFG